jgi:hypothetical protein
LHNNDSIQCIVSGDAACLTPDSVVTQPLIITVTPIVTPTVSISPADTFVCTGSNPVFTAQAVNEGATPTYQWQINGVAIGGVGPTYTAIQPVNGSSITVTLISNAACASPDTVTSSPALLSVDSPSILIAGDTALSAGATVSITATASTTAANPIYQWQDSTTSRSWQNFSASGQTISYSPGGTGDRLRCILTDAAGCSATSNTITFSLNSSTSGAAYYPNPAYSILNIENTEPNDPIVALTITDAFGNQCLALYNLNGQDPVKAEVAQLVKGIYFVTLMRTSGKSGHFSFVKL